MRSRFLFGAVLLLILYPSPGFGGGSVGWTQVRSEILRDDPAFLGLLEAQFEIARVGGAMRVGHDANGQVTVPELGLGARMPPYEFHAKPRGAPGDYSLCLTLEPVVPPRSAKDLSGRLRLERN